MSNKQISSQGDSGSAPTDPSVDLVLIFQCAPPEALKAGAKPDEAANAEISKEYSRLILALKDAGLYHTSRAGKEKGTVLVFVRAHAHALVAARRAERMNEFLHGAGAPPGAETSTAAFSAAERIRYAHSLLTLPSRSSSGTQDGTVVPGAGLSIKSKEWPHLLDIAALHDTAYNKAWIERWGKLGSMLSIKDADLDTLRDHFGEQVALYFGFLAFYFSSLLVLAPIALFFWSNAGPFSASYSVLLVLWVLGFTESWRMREKKLSVRWGTYGTDVIAQRRKDFKPETTRVDKATGEKEEVFEWWRRESRMAVSIPVMLFFAALLGAVLTTMFAVEVFATKLYDGVGAALVPQLPTALFVVAVPQIMGAWQATASALTSWENHRSAQNHESSLTIKTFALQGFVSYGALTLSALVYIPFGQSIMNELVSRGFFAQPIARALRRGTLFRNERGEVAFDINPARMHNQLFAVLTTTQAIGAFTELALPFILRKVNEYREQRAEASSGTKSPKTPETRFLHRATTELALPTYETFGDYAEMATQLGYVVLWSTLWPLAPIMALVNNFFELRSDALKVTLNSRRPIPQRTTTIGPWLDVLSFIAWLAAMTNTALVYLFAQSPEAQLEGHSAYETVMRSHHVGPTSSGITPSGEKIDASASLPFCSLLPKFLPCSSAVSALATALLLSLVAERAYSVVRSAAQHLLERALWRGSEEETVLRRREWQSRQLAVQQHVSSGNSTGAAGPLDIPARDASIISAQEALPDAAFWDPTGDVGLSVIQQAAGKRE
ncbi:Protein required for meiotic chromosome segregation [Ceraceosorus bombacis]|uniref:Protein required for meiotic chromosome segregation n=1 Tax=Ceraceosorus bombacis TaxID=401625 RepID=A0A0P1BDP1_9BASI|nr:Protein required for meiotic chromosome segregation [Ceraceosorus bombacis]